MVGGGRKERGSGGGEGMSVARELDEIKGWEGESGERAARERSV